ncbi:MAG: hypothetical protein H0U23_10085 [Blastocatellia bacterium]|nr:hypothetical protein [Blastocatellia bacterium]
MSNFYGRLKAKSTSARPTRTVGVTQAALALLAFNVGCLIVYNAQTVRSLLTSDAVAKNLIAAEMARSNEIFLTDWYYVNGDLWTFFSHFLILPLLAFFPNGFALHAFAGLVTGTLVLLFSWWVLRSLKTPALSKILMLAVLASGISGSMAWALFGETGYGWVLLTSLMFLSLLLPFFLDDNELDRRLRGTLAVLIALLSFIVHLGNPTRALASYFIPALGGLTALLLAPTAADAPRRWKFWTTRGILPFSALLIGAIVGAAVYARLIQNLNDIVGAGSALFLPLERLGHSAGYTLLGLISLLGGEPPAGQMLPTLSGAFSVLRLIAALSMLVFPLWLLRNYFHRLNPSQLFVAGFAATAFGIVLCVCMLTNTPDYSDLGAARASARYFAPSVALLLLAFASMAHLIRSALVRAGVLAIAVIVSTSSWAVLVSGDSSKTDDVRSAVLKVLRENGLTHGYASYWNAGVYTVLTGQEIKIRQVQLTHGGIIPMRHLSADHWYRGYSSGRPTFLLLTETEYQWLRDNGLLGCPHSPAKTLPVLSMRILVYAQDFSSSLLGWDDSSSTYERRVCLLAQTPRTVGRFISDSRALVSSQKDGPGYLMFGPYVSLRAGDYVYRAMLRIESSDVESAGLVDVTGESGKEKFAAISLPAHTGNYTIELPFSVRRDAKGVELRTWVSGSANVMLESATLIRRDSINESAASRR